MIIFFALILSNLQETVYKFTFKGSVLYFFVTVIEDHTFMKYKNRLREGASEGVDRTFKKCCKYRDCLLCAFLSIGLYHPLDGVTNPQYKLLHF